MWLMSRLIRRSSIPVCRMIGVALGGAGGGQWRLDRLGDALPLLTHRIQPCPSPLPNPNILSSLGVNHAPRGLSAAP
jgi:hypothetical protein